MRTVPLLLLCAALTAAAAALAGGNIPNKCDTNRGGCNATTACCPAPQWTNICCAAGTKCCTAPSNNFFSSCIRPDDQCCGEGIDSAETWGCPRSTVCGAEQGLCLARHAFLLQECSGAASACAGATCRNATVAYGCEDLPAAGLSVRRTLSIDVYPGAAVNVQVFNATGCAARNENKAAALLLFNWQCAKRANSTVKAFLSA
jgi:hypothetical protein